MKTLSVRFRAEKRKDKTGVLIDTNVPLLADINFRGRTWGTPGIRLQNISDFDVTFQKILPGKKVLNGTFLLSATMGNLHLDEYKMKLFNAYKQLQGDENSSFSVQDILHNAFPVPENDKHPEISRNTAYDIIISKSDEWLTEGVIGQNRKYKYDQFARIVDRFSKIIEPFYFEDATSILMLSLLDYIANEYQYVKTHPTIFENEKRPPSVKKGNNTMSTFIKMLGGFFIELGIPNPLKENKKTGKNVMKEQYGEPIYLTIDELLHCVESDYPTEYKLERDSFLVQCFLGLRVGDYILASKITPTRHAKGFFFLLYAPTKTNIHSKNLEIIETPLVQFVEDVFLEYNNTLPFAEFLKGKAITKYNSVIRLLLEHWGITREVIQRNGDDTVRVPLNSIASNKIARKTFVDIITKSQLNPYAAGLHKVGSSAVNHYTAMDLHDKYRFFSMAFRQVDKLG